MVKKEQNTGVIKVLILIIVILVIILIGIISNKNKEKKILEENIAVQTQTAEQIQQKAEDKVKKSPNEIQVLPTTLDEIYDNSIWCGTFQLVWNDMVDTLTKNGKVETSNLQIVKNLNEKSFLETDLSKEYYYKTYGIKSLKLKKEIEKGIKDKFNENSSILDEINWESGEGYLFYVMLKREFKFEHEFEELSNGKFGEYENVEYFGLTKNAAEESRGQVDVLYYNEDSYAVTLKAKEGDEVVLVKKPEGKTFEEIYENVKKESDKFTGSKIFDKEDTLKVPNFDFKVLKRFSDLNGVKFQTKDGIDVEIDQALQSIEFELDRTGGKVKSEAVVGTSWDAAIASTPRKFNFDEEFTIFLKEENGEKPYFAANVSNIKLFQND